MPNLLPATGSAISFGRVYKAYTGSYPSSKAVAMLGNNNTTDALLTLLFGSTQSSSVARSLSWTFGNRYAPYSTTDDDNRSDRTSI